MCRVVFVHIASTKPSCVLSKTPACLKHAGVFEGTHGGVVNAHTGTWTMHSHISQHIQNTHDSTHTHVTPYVTPHTCNTTHTTCMNTTQTHPTPHTSTSMNTHTTFKAQRPPSTQNTHMTITNKRKTHTHQQNNAKSKLPKCLPDPK